MVNKLIRCHHHQYFIGIIVDAELYMPLTDAIVGFAGILSLIVFSCERDPLRMLFFVELQPQIQRHANHTSCILCFEN